MRNKQTKTNAMRQLDAAGIPYTTKDYEVDDNNLGGVHVAEVLGQSPDQVFKTLVLHNEKNEHLVCCIPSSCELDLKKVARASGNKKVEMIPMKTLFDITGYIRGGCTPIAMKKKFPTFIDETAQLYDEIAISAGVRGMQIIIEPETLKEFVEAEFADLTFV